MAAVLAGNTDIGEFLIANKAAVNARDQHGATAVMVAAMRGHAPALSLLIAHGGDINAKDNLGVTPLMAAAWKCHVETTRVLWGAGVNYEDTDNVGKTAWEYAKFGNCPLIIRVAAAEDCKDLSSLYSEEDLARWAPIFRSKISEVQTNIEKQLGVEDRNRLHQTDIQTPIWDERCKQPFHYNSSSRDRKIVIPILSLRFLRDLLYVDQWAIENGYQVKAQQYVNMLKYKRATDFRGARYPPPLGVLGLENMRSADSQGKESRDRLDAIFNGALFFIVAHEATHVLRDHARSTPENEKAADKFAFELLSSSSLVPEGIVDFFRVASYWTRNAGDFESPYVYVIWVSWEATHPVTASRIRMLAMSLSESPKSDFSLPNLRIKDMSVALEEAAREIEQDTMATDLFAMALHTNPSTLVPEKKDETSELARIWRKWLFRGPPTGEFDPLRRPQ